MTKARSYRREYDTYHSRPEQIRNRAARNKARREAGCGKGMEADHVRPLSRGGSNSKSNVRCISRHANRTKGAKVR